MASLSVDLLHEACKHGTEQHLELALKASSKADVNKYVESAHFTRCDTYDSMESLVMAQLSGPTSCL